MYVYVNKRAELGQQGNSAIENVCIIIITYSPEDLWRTRHHCPNQYCLARYISSGV